MVYNFPLAIMLKFWNINFGILFIYQGSGLPVVYNIFLQNFKLWDIKLFIPFI